jgi:hypothetical protein
MRITVMALALFLAGCGPFDGSPAKPRALTGRGYVHYHLYPDTGQCYCGVGFDFTRYGKMVAAAPETLLAYFGDDVCVRPLQVDLVSESTGKRVRVTVVDKGGQAEGNFDLRERHIMDLSAEAFRVLDADGEGMKAGRIYVTWEATQP